MLLELEIKDILLVKELSLGFSPGLNVFTGETGTGKSILLDCLGFVLGARGQAELVRNGASRGEVIAIFSVASIFALTIIPSVNFDFGGFLIIIKIIVVIQNINNTNQPVINA